MVSCTASLIVATLFSVSFVRGTFVQPEPLIRNLSLWASVQVDQVCGGNCYNSFQNVSCKDSRVCRDYCNGRVGLPAVEYPLRDWSLEQNNDGCSVRGKDTPSSPSTVFATDTDDRMLIVNGSSDTLSPCYSQRNNSVDGLFTLTFWIMADCRNCSVISLLLKERAPVYIRVIRDNICLDQSCIQQQNIDTQWKMVGVRIMKGQVTVFISNQQLKLDNNTEVVNIYIGSEDVVPINDIFRLYQVHYYRDALSLREIEVLRTGMTDPSFTSDDCQCPIDHFEEVDNNNCTDGVSYVQRIPVMFYNASVTVDGDSNTYWASSNQGDVVLMLNLSVSFQIVSIRISFESKLPNQVSFSLLSEGQQKSSGDFICANKTCTQNMPSLDVTSSQRDFDVQTADTIKIQLHRQMPQEAYNFVIAEIEIIGRCNCAGNADNCVLNPGNKSYTCSCKPETHSLGPHCQTCAPNYFRLSDQSDCSNSCLCNMDGVVNASNPCEEVGGKCMCKKNVEGQTCDVCKPFFFHFGASATNGCEACNCNQNGSLSCSESAGCVCKANTKPPSCDQCVQYSYGFSTPEGCRLCSCSEAGTVAKNKSCDEYTGQCECKTNVDGLRCDICKPKFYDLETANQQGCKPCDCHPVGSDGLCDNLTGQCHCRGGILINKACTPQITSIDPTYGPSDGGTLVSISGNLLGNNSASLAVYLNETLQDLITVTDMMVVFRTAANRPFSQSATPLKLSWKEDNKPLVTQTAFSYRGNPVIDSTRAQNVTTFASGGCQVKIYGMNLGSAKYPKLEVALSSNPTNKAVATCRHNLDYVICPTPNLRGLYTSASDRFMMTAVFDGVNSSAIGNIEVKPDPEMHSVGTIDFQYPFEDTITLQGKGLNTACQEHELKVFTGTISCTITRITDTEIKCKPAISPPGDYKRLPIQVIVGNIQKQVGTLHYLDLHETTGFIIIISCIAAAIGIAIIVIIICCIWRRRKKKMATPLIASDADASKAFAELTKPIEEPVMEVHSQDVPVLKETVFREPKKGIVNTEAEDAVFSEEFLPKVNADLREDLTQCYIGAGHFVLGRHCALKGKHAQLIDGSLQKSGPPAVKLTIKSLMHPITASQLPVWANMALSECLRLRHYKHAHVLSILGVGVYKDQFHILYQRMSQYILKTLICDATRDFSIRQLLNFGHQVAEGITFLASKDVTHKDVAARNCMVDESSQVKLCDAAFSWDYFEKEYVYDEQRERYLPIRWMAPESIKDGYYDMRTDVWSFAVLVWELLTRGCLPYHEATSSQEVSDYITQGYILGKPDIVNDRIFELMCSCWAEENEQRPAISAVSKTLSDILEIEDDGIYANVGEVAASHNSKRNSVQLRQSPGADRGRTYSSSRLSNI
ncbi:hypothetical protein BsWGS_04211 [Bradybaena similaris]